MNIKHLILVLIANLICVTSLAQVDAHFEVRHGAPYAIIVNHGLYPVFVSWRCVNYQTKEYRDGTVNLLGGYEQEIGPNFNWYWRTGEQFLYQVGNNTNNISFKGNNSDGYIHNGTIQLRRTISGKYDTFDFYNKRGVPYVRYGNTYYNISGSGTVTINNIKYNKP